MKFLARYWFMICLAIMFVGGMVWAQPLEPLARLREPRDIVVAMVLFITALPVSIDAIRRAVGQPWPPLAAVALSIGFLPLAMWPVSAAFSADIGNGLMATAVAPGTLATAAVLTRRARGNELVPVMVTIITNLSCVVVAPLWLFVATRTDSSSITGSLSLTDMVAKLSVLVLIPMLAAQVVRKFGTIGAWAEARRHILSVLAQIGILYVVLIGAIQCGHRMQAAENLRERLLAIGLMIVVVTFMHCLALAAGWFLAGWRRWGYADQVGVAFAGSQKTLMIGLQLSLLLGGGLTILPIVSYHFMQLMIDAYLAERLRDRHPSSP